MTIDALMARLAGELGPRGFTRDADLLAPALEDWRGRYRGAALAMVSPASTAEVAAVVRACAEARIPVVPQGGNTSMVGGATPSAAGNAILLSLRRMTAVRAVAVEDGRLVAEAGVPLETVHHAAREHGLRFPMSLAAKGTATVGGILSTNAGGTQVLRWGTTRALVAGLEAVLPDGSVMSTLSGLSKDNRGPDVLGLLIGAEGTLGVITAASLKLVPEPEGRSVAWVGLVSAPGALALLRALERRMPGAVESFELVPARALQLVLAHVNGARAPLAGDHAWHVLIEAVGDENASEALTLALSEEADRIEDATIAAGAAAAERLWHLRESISEAERRAGPAAKHDISVPVSRMGEFIETTAPLVEKRFPDTRVVAFGHLGDGNVHFNVLAPPGAGADWPAGKEGLAVTRFIHDRVLAEGGSISAEHGIGQMKREEYLRTADPARLAAQAAIKRALDPLGIMNPGKLLADVGREP